MGKEVFGDTESELCDLKKRIVTSVEAIEERYGERKGKIIFRLIEELTKETRDSLFIAQGSDAQMLRAALDMIVQAKKGIAKIDPMIAKSLTPTTKNLREFIKKFQLEEKKGR